MEKNYLFLFIYLGSFTIDNGEKVITCVNCYQTLTHQWTEHERMKVPLEMRKYNWMAVQRSSSPSNDIKVNYH